MIYDKSTSSWPAAYTHLQRDSPEWLAMFDDPAIADAEWLSTMEADDAAVTEEADAVMALLTDATMEDLPELLATLSRFAAEDGDAALMAGLASLTRLLLVQAPQSA